MGARRSEVKAAAVADAAARARASPSASAKATAAGPTCASAAASAVIQVVRLRKSNTERPEANRAVRPVGSTWFGPAT